MLTSAVIIVLCCSVASIQAWPCDSSPCKNGGTCNSLVFTYSCTCPITATGANCQTLLTDDVKCLGNTNTLYQGYDGTKVKFHPVFTPALYQVSLRFISLGYTVAAQYRYGSTADSEAFRLKLAQNLADAGFEPYTTFYGKTGASSTTPDASGLITYRTSDNIILVTCHGSLAANLAAEIVDPESDWGTDFNYNVVTASAAGLTDIAGDVQMHAGVAGNYKSFQAALNQQISTILNTKLTSQSPVWIYVTGHSLGGGMSVLVGPGIRAFLNNNQRTDVNVGVVALSGLTIFSGQTAQTWIGNSIGHCNILRLDVKGDPVTVLPPLTQYKHVGVHFLDDIDNVHSKQIALYGSPLDAGFAVAAYHYGQVTRFDYDIVMKHSEFTYRRQYALNSDYGTRYAINTPV